MIPAAFINPGDITLMTVPGYPVAGTHTKYYGGKVHDLPLREENGFYPDLDGIPDDVARRRSCWSSIIRTARPARWPRAISTSGHRLRPQQPDRRRAGRRPCIAELRRTAVEFLADGRREGGRRRDPLDVEGLQHDRLAHGVRRGHAKIVQAFADVKDNSDSGQFMAIQQAAKAALDHPELGDRVRAKYHRRLKKLVDALNKVGFKAKMPGGTYFLYVKCAEGVRRDRSFANAEEASQFLIHEQSVICVPWDNAGRICASPSTYLAKDEREENALMTETVNRLGRLQLRF